MDAEALLPRAIEEATVSYGPGPAFYHHRGGKNHMRLSYSYVSESRIEEGIKGLGGLLRSMEG